MTGSITLVTLAGGSAFYYYAQKDKTPGPQLPHDPSKKTLVICGSGWGATSLLNSLDTEDYNVVSVSALAFGGCVAHVNDDMVLLRFSVDCDQPEELLPVHTVAA